MAPPTRLTEALGIRHPIVLAPMASVGTPELVAAVPNAGGLGSLGGAMMDPDALRKAIGEIRELTDRPFAVNLFAWSVDPPRRTRPSRRCATTWHPIATCSAWKRPTYWARSH